MINKIRWLVMRNAVFTTSGESELHAAFATKKAAVAWLREAVPNGKERRHRWHIERYVQEETS